jgi:hypothetical protein
MVAEVNEVGAPEGDEKSVETASPATLTKSPQISARQSLVDWANRQDGWVRALVNAILTGSDNVSEVTLESIFDHYLAEKDLTDVEAEQIDSLTIGDEEMAIKAPLLIDKLSAVGGVNALAPGQEIEFNANLTVLFGENGSGKTGYTRILKTLADVRTIEPILGDVNEVELPADPRCTLSYTVDGTSSDLDWNGETGVVPFTAISIFDSPAVQLHVDEDLSYQYTPSDLALFPFVGDGIDRVHVRLEDEIRKRKPKGNPFLSHFTRGTAAYTLIETLGPATDLAALGELATPLEAAAPRLDVLASTTDALRGGAVTAQITAARSRRDLYAKLVSISKAIEGFPVDAYQAAVETAEKAEAAYEELRDELAQASGVEGEEAERWQQFVLSGETYREHLASHDDGPEDETCIYCRQPLDDDAQALLARYREFANDAIRQRLQDANDQTALLSKDVLELDLDAAQDALGAAREGQEEDSVLVAAATFLTTFTVVNVQLRERKTPPWDTLLNEAIAVRAAAETRGETAKELIESLSAKEADREANLRAAESEHGELKDRVELDSRMDTLVEYVEAAKWAQRAEELAKRFRSLSRSLTVTAKAASGVLLNSDFEERFKQECEALRAPSVALAFPGRRGEPARRKTVSAEHKPSKVLSEGEQKVIALADFLAEASLRLVPAPLIFDDPVNSLDYLRINEVSDRIAQLAVERQVIVFTHNIWLAVALLGRFEKNKDACTYYRVSDEGGKGMIAKGVHPRWDTVSKTEGRINKAIQDAKTREGDEREIFVERAYSLIRTWCEVVVEKELFAGVLGRFAPNVMMSSLASVKTDRLDAAITTILPIFEKACRVMEGHSQPLESLGVTPSLSDAEADWDKLRNARKKYIA